MWFIDVSAVQDFKSTSSAISTFWCPVNSFENINALLGDPLSKWWILSTINGSGCLHLPIPLSMLSRLPHYPTYSCSTGFLKENMHLIGRLGERIAASSLRILKKVMAKEELKDTFCSSNDFWRTLCSVSFLSTLELHYPSLKRCWFYTLPHVRFR